MTYLNTAVLGGAQGVNAANHILIKVRVDSATANYAVRLMARNNDDDGGANFRITNVTNGRTISFETNDPPDASTATDNDPLGPFADTDLPSVTLVTLVNPGNLDASSVSFPFVALDSPAAVGRPG